MRKSGVQILTLAFSYVSRGVPCRVAGGSTHLDAVGHVVVAWLWLDVELTAQGNPYLTLDESAS
jgi:hypothetical protein